MAIGIIVGLSIVECLVLIRNWKRGRVDRRGAAMVWMLVAAAFLLLVLTGIIEWGFRWYALGAFLFFRTLIAVVFIFRTPVRSGFKRGRAIRATLGRIVLLGLAAVPLILFPSYKALEPTGSHAVGTAVFTWTDTSRDEAFTPQSDSRKLTVQLWYPAQEAGVDAPALQGIFPLAVFSHGAFGYRLSNYSTFMELASNGYIVASIDHTHQAFMTREADGTVILGDQGFMSTAMRVENGEIQGEELYRLEQDWMALRSADLVFVLDQIRQYVASSSSTSTSTSTAPPPEHSFMSIFQQIDIEKIGVLGHSMGGATAAWLGREDLAVDAVVVLDGTMMGEVTGFESDKYMFTKVPYPKPILNIFNERHYHDGKQLGLDYANMRIHANAPLSFQAVVQGAGHLNFTDLPLISPILGRMLGTGSVDARYCIQETNRAVLEFLDYYVKDKGSAIPVFRTL